MTCCNVDKNRFKQCFAAYIVYSIAQYSYCLLDSGSTILCKDSVLLITMNKVSSKTFFKSCYAAGLELFCCIYYFSKQAVSK